MPTDLPTLLRVLDAVESTGARYWLEGGWGVDALVGRQTREHRDADIDMDARAEQDVLEALGALGYVIDTDWRPTRVELAAPDGSFVDVHPLQLRDDGSARQAALGGGWHDFEARWFTTAALAGREIPCVSAEAQRVFRTGYELRDVDRHDISQLDALE